MLDPDQRQRFLDGEMDEDEMRNLGLMMEGDDSEEGEHEN